MLDIFAKNKKTVNTNINDETKSFSPQKWKIISFFFLKVKEEITYFLQKNATWNVCEMVINLGMPTFTMTLQNIFELTSLYTATKIY